jgi:hypothetical protein
MSAAVLQQLEPFSSSTFPVCGVSVYVMCGHAHTGIRRLGDEMPAYAGMTRQVATHHIEFILYYHRIDRMSKTSCALEEILGNFVNTLSIHRAYAGASFGSGLASEQGLFC